MSTLANRHEFVLFFDVSNGNPNGDPDAGNLPRIDPETNQGLVSDVAIKRKVRNYIAMTKDGAPGFGIYMTERTVLNETHQQAYDATGIKMQAKKLPKGDDGRAITAWMCQQFFDIRTFGAVMTTEVNAGQVRGPVQLAFARSAEPILPQEVAITRSSVTNERDLDKERTMGRKHIVPYGLYRMHGFVNAKLAEKTGFTDTDLELLWEAVEQMFEFDRSASRGEMAVRKLLLFRHDSPLGNAPAHRLFESVSVFRANGGDLVPTRDERLHNAPPARAFSDYAIRVDTESLPHGVQLTERV